MYVAYRQLGIGHIWCHDSGAHLYGHLTVQKWKDQSLIFSNFFASMYCLWCRKNTKKEQKPTRTKNCKSITTLFARSFVGKKSTSNFSFFYLFYPTFLWSYYYSKSSGYGSLKKVRNCLSNVKVCVEKL